ncbi:Uma2 family endonuclease [Oceanobacillus bengalensis]|uniref:Uma2 family endonuclease n=1 Tax=Oceanobacillus bengalensis TaxID=1435466 RepID=A0A494Z6H8_9BACI|nr:Uma2 family endonuclease [Oceanobacillus bengalensis]RKQ18172.1 Uma2 family endonuclease [Oceanobacillus bengalensis]
MSLPSERKVSLEEFYILREESDQLLEYIDGVVYIATSPSTVHQRISGRLHAQLFQLLEGKECEVFHAPFDIQLSSANMEDKKIVIPDLSVICEKDGLKADKYIGAPTMVIEITSPSNQSHDLVTKLNLYMQNGVKEYWIVNPLLNSVQIYTLDQAGNYQQKDVAKDTGIVKSSVVEGFRVDLEGLFQ